MPEICFPGPTLLPAGRVTVVRTGIFARPGDRVESHPVSARFGLLVVPYTVPQDHEGELEILVHSTLPYTYMAGTDQVIAMLEES